MLYLPEFNIVSVKKESLSMRAYTMQIKEICDLLASCGNPVSSVEQIAAILNGLPLEYDLFVDFIFVSHDPYTVDGARILTIVMTLKLTLDAPTLLILLVTKKDVPDLNVNSANTFSSTPNLVEVAYVPCVTATPNSEMPSLASMSSPDTIQVNSLVASMFGINGQTWFPDSGVTHHVTKDDMPPYSSSPYIGKGQVHLGDGSSLAISHIGQATLYTHDKALFLNELLHVPCINKNLFSVSKFTRTMLLCGSQVEGLHNILGECLQHSIKAHTATTKLDEKPAFTFGLWHQHLGHPARSVNFPWKLALTSQTSSPVALSQELPVHDDNALCSCPLNNVYVSDQDDHGLDGVEQSHSQSNPSASESTTPPIVLVA
ncbi:hypothetical protein GQ457_17G010950 [Hibiscus cannabinus]